jgi:hypothetical protein
MHIPNADSRGLVNKRAWRAEGCTNAWRRDMGARIARVITSYANTQALSGARRRLGPRHNGSACYDSIPSIIMLFPNWSAIRADTLPT